MFRVAYHTRLVYRITTLSFSILYFRCLEVIYNIYSESPIKDLEFHREKEVSVPD